MSKHVIEFIARGVLTSEHGVLLCMNVERGYYYIPGGHMDFGESAELALVREFLEETGLGVRVCGFLGAMEASFRDSRERHELNLVFHVEHVAGAIGLDQPSLEPDIAFRWVKLADVSRIDFRPRPMLDIVERGTAWVSFAKVD